MAQNVTIAGAQYSDVPGIEIPKTNELGNALFLDAEEYRTSAEQDVIDNTKAPQPLFVAFTKSGNVWSADKTFAEIGSALDSGKYVYGGTGSDYKSWSELYICIGIGNAPVQLGTDVAYYFVNNLCAEMTPIMRTLAVGDNNAVALLSANVPKVQSIGGQEVLVKTDTDGYLSNAVPSIDYVIPGDLNRKLNIQQSVSHAGEFLIIGEDGKITSRALLEYEGEVE